MIGSDNPASSALPGQTAVRAVRIVGVPKLVPIIIQVAVPGPAWSRFGL